VDEKKQPQEDRLRRIHQRLDELVPEDALASFRDKLEELVKNFPEAEALLMRLAPPVDDGRKR
jgi:hypothetical protein